MTRAEAEISKKILNTQSELLRLSVRIKKIEERMGIETTADHEKSARRGRAAFLKLGRSVEKVAKILLQEPPGGSENEFKLHDV